MDATITAILDAIVQTIVNLFGATTSKQALDESHAKAVAMQAARDAADIAEAAKFP